MADDRLIVAHKIRDHMEKFAATHSYIGCTQTLACYCAISSWTLHRCFVRLGFDSTFVVGVAFDRWGEANEYDETDINHAWVESNGFVYDVTATQFNCRFRRVHNIKVGGRSYTANYVPIHKGAKAIKDVKAGKRNDSISWGEQSPHCYQSTLSRIAKIVAAKFSDGRV